jgi:acyl-CoA reductase-like NAD-dependent aldehyde dehydrogenase
MARIDGNQIVVVDPRSGTEAGTITCTSIEAVPGLVARARAAQRTFAARPLAERKRVVRALGAALLARADALADALVAEIGKPAGEAWTSEIVTTQELLDYWLEAIDDALEPMPLDLNPVNYPGKEVEVRLDPVGVVGMIMPWNYPVNLPLRTIVPALLAGNAVVWKPSEHAARCAAVLAEAFAVALPEGLVTTIQGGPAHGAALVDAGVDRVVFVGSVATGRLVAARCAERLVPVSLELGSKDPAIVLHDADLERAAQGIVWGAFHNAGQDCASVERVYVDRRVYDAFVQRVVAITRTLRIGHDVGPLVTQTQLDKVDAHVKAAVAAGARALVGGAPTGAGFHYAPTVLVDVNEEMDVFREETFGPVLPIAAFDTEDEAVTRANASPYGLCASVWSKDVKRAEQLVLRVDCGTAYVNNCCFTGPMGGAAWSGRKDSGGGVTGSRFGMDALVRPRTVCVDRSRSKREMWWYPYGDALVTMARGLVELGRSGGAKVAGAKMAVTGLMNRWK